MTRIAPTIFYFIVAFAVFPLTFAMTARPALAQSGVYYRAEFVQPVTASQIVERDLLWSCAGQTCQAGESNSRDAIVCGALVRKLGPVSAFAAGGKPFDEKQLANCNGRAS